MLAHRHSLPQAPGIEKEQAKTVDVEPIAKKSGSLVALDIDKGNGPQFVPDLACELYAHFRSREASTSVQPLYMDDQDEITEHMRMILVDWIVQASLHITSFAHAAPTMLTPAIGHFRSRCTQIMLTVALSLLGS